MFDVYHSARRLVSYLAVTLVRAALSLIVTLVRAVLVPFDCYVSALCLMLCLIGYLCALWCVV